MNNKVYYDALTIASVVFLAAAALIVGGTIKASWSPEVLFIWAAAFFVARDYRW